jgi:hypothetical protein
MILRFWLGLSLKLRLNLDFLGNLIDRNRLNLESVSKVVFFNSVKLVCLLTYTFLIIELFYDD